MGFLFLGRATGGLNSALSFDPGPRIDLPGRDGGGVD